MQAVVQAPTVALPAAAEPRPLPPAGVDPAPVLAAPVATGGTLADVLARHQAVSLVVLHRGRLAVDWRRPGADPAGRHVCYSVTKSFTGTLAALAVAEGALDRAAPVADLVPELAAAGLGDATVGQVADMTASIAYGEDYLDAAAGPSPGPPYGFGDYIAALEGAPGAPGGLRGLLGRMGHGPRPHGEAFGYATPLTDALGWMVERVRGRPYPDLLGDALWAHVGAEGDATLGLAADGTPMLGIGLAMTTRDLARAGLVWAEARHVPGAVVESMRAGDPATFARGGRYDYLSGYAYRDHWWLPGGPQRPLSAWGIYGQLLWVEPDAGLVVALHSDGPRASDRARDLDHDALARAVSALAAGWG